MANPELLIYSALRSLFTRSLPKGGWMLQRIETSTGTGIPDCYFCLKRSSSSPDVSLPNINFWIETKTVDYKVSNEQLNWAATHWRANGQTWVITRIKHTPTTRPRTPTASSNPQPYVTPYPQLLELQNGSPTGIVSYDQLINSTQKKSQETLIFLAFDDRMRECSTLGSYLRKFNPDVLPVEHWLAQQMTSR